MSSSTSKNKRKADTISGGDLTDGSVGGRPAAIARLKDAKSVSDPTSGGTPHIPPPVWGHVLDYMPYEEVRSALLVGKIIATEAVKYVRALNFMKSFQMDIPSARRFPNVEEVNCLSLISGDGYRQVLCKDTTIRLAPLLGTFPKINYIYIGGLIPITPEDTELELISYSSRFCSSPGDHSALFVALCQSLLGAFKTRLISPNLGKMEGVLECAYGRIGVCSGERGQGMCETCKEICSYFPLQDVFEHLDSFCRCVEDIDAYAEVAKRKGAKKLFLSSSTGELSFFLDNNLSDFKLENAESKEEEALRDRLEDLGMKWKSKAVWYPKKSDFNYLDRLIAAGFDPRAISKKDLYEEVHLGVDSRECDVFAKSTFDALVARGFALDEADLHCVGRTGGASSGELGRSNQSGVGIVE